MLLEFIELNFRVIKDVFDQIYHIIDTIPLQG